MELIKSSVNNWIKVISLILGILVFSLGEIALSDIGRIYKVRSGSEIMDELQKADEKTKISSFTEDIKALELKIDDVEYTISGLEEDIKSKKNTLDQLLDNQKINPNQETELSIKEYQQQFLQLQSRKDGLKAQALQLKSDLTTLQREEKRYLEVLHSQYDMQVEKISRKEVKAKEMKVLVTQMVLLIVLLAIGVALFVRFRNTPFLFPALGYNLAILVMLAQAIYIHSPFKLHFYTFIFIGIAVCVVLMAWLVKNLSRISKKETLGVIKKSLAAGKCPRCSANISLQPFRKENIGGQKLKSFVLVAIVLAALFGNGSGIVILFSNLSTINATEIIVSTFLIFFPWIIAYLFFAFLSPFAQKKIPDPVQFNNNNCPVCGLQLITTCSKCESPRHNLLPFCNNCGNKLEEETGKTEEKK